MNKLSVLALLFIASPSWSLETITCPSIQVFTTLEDTSDGWQAQQDNRMNNDNRLITMAFSDGKPSEQGFLKPINRREATSTSNGYEQYSLQDMTRDYYANCIYTNTTASYSKKIDPQHSECTVVHGNNSQLRAVCK